MIDSRVSGHSDLHSSQAGWTGDLQGSHSIPKVGRFYPRHDPTLLLRCPLGSHPSRRVGTLIRLDVTWTCITVLGPPMGTQTSVRAEVVASTPDGFLLGNPTWRPTGGHLGTRKTNTLRLRCRFRFRRSDNSANRRIQVVERHVNLPVAGRSWALNEPTNCTGEMPWNLGSTARRIEISIWQIAPLLSQSHATDV